MGAVKRVERGRHYLLGSERAYFDLEIDLARRTDRHEVRVDLLGLGLTLDVLAGELVVLAFKPELDVFVAELGFEKCAKQCDAV